MCVCRCDIDVPDRRAIIFWKRGIPSVKVAVLCAHPAIFCANQDELTARRIGVAARTLTKRRASDPTYATSFPTVGRVGEANARRRGDRHVGHQPYQSHSRGNSDATTAARSGCRPAPSGRRDHFACALSISSCASWSHLGAGRMAWPLSFANRTPPACTRTATGGVSLRQEVGIDTDKRFRLLGVNERIGVSLVRRLFDCI